jgi:hypothetical protein
MGQPQSNVTGRMYTSDGYINKSVIGNHNTSDGQLCWLATTIFLKLPVTGQYTHLSLVMFCSRLLTFTSDGHNAACHWYLLPVTCMFLPVTNVLKAISYSAVVLAKANLIGEKSCSLKHFKDNM